MELTIDTIRSLFSPKDYTKGLDVLEKTYFNLDIESDLDKEVIMANIRERYSTRFVTITYEEPEFSFRCTCSDFSRNKACCHCAAVLLSYYNRQKHQREHGSDNQVGWLIRNYSSSYQTETAHDMDVESIEEGSVSIQPTLYFGGIGNYNGGIRYPMVSVTIGSERQYVVKNPRELIQRFNQKDSYSYGKKFVLKHSKEYLDESSKILLGILSDCCEVGHAYTPYTRSDEKNKLTFSGYLFSRFFDLFVDRTVLTEKNRVLTLRSGDPEIILKIRKSGEGVVVQSRKCIMFGDSRAYYAVVGDTIYRCSDLFGAAMYPMLSGNLAALYFTVEDFTEFCSYVFPKIRDHVTLRDPDGLMEQYCPEECIPRFVLDYNRSEHILTAQLSFRYHDTVISDGVSLSQMPSVRRDFAAERAAENLLSSCMDHTYKYTYTISNNDRIYLFLMDKLPLLQTTGEVYLSDSLSALRVSAASVNVGLSVSGGLLHLDFDTGEFPPEELEALYQSLILRKKYHRLKDGRYLSLNGSDAGGLSQLAQALHMSQLSPKDMKNGSVTVPLYRSFYLDSLLSGDAGLRVYRDNTLRSMIRQFKTVDESDYTIPESMEKILRPYQETGFRWLKTLESCGFGGILADEMGLGKTVEMITYLMTVCREQVGLPSMIACPTSLVYNWADEFKRFAPGMKIRLIVGTIPEREELLSEARNSDDDVLITSYDILKRDRERYRDFEFYSFILDEGQMVKNQTTLASQSVKMISCKQRFVMTGTPIENRLSELWNLFDFLMPGYLFTHSRFTEKLEKPIIKSGSAEAQEQLKKLVAPFLLRRLKKDVLKELPPKIEETRIISLSEEERAVYAASVLAAKGQLSNDGENKVGKFAFLAALTRLREICCEPHLCYENYVGDTSKLDACVELCSSMTENGHQVLLFSQFTAMLDILRERLTYEGISTFTLQGSTSKEERANLVRAFNEGGAQVFLISLKAGGTGLNLTSADVVIHYDPWWNQAAQDQATDRAHRIGQKSCVHVYRLITKDTIEERILALQEKKASLLDSVSEGNEQSILSLTKEELLALLD